MAEASKKLRSDAQRNRDKIIAAARKLFALQGTDTPMEDIARAAGVGVGTLYRRFHSRESLIETVAADLSKSLVATATRACEQEADNWSALVRLLRMWADLHLYVLADSAVGEPWFELLDKLVRGAQADGRMRHDVSTQEIAAFMNLLVQGTSCASNALPGNGLRGRLLTVMLAGLRDS